MSVMRTTGNTKTSHERDPICTADHCRNERRSDAPVPLCERHLWIAFAFIAPEVPALPIDMLMSRRYEDDPQYDPEPQRTGYRIDTPGWVYFIRKDGLIKIGWSSKPKDRLRALRPDEVLHMQPGTVLDERRCHRAFVHRRVHHEWFTPGDDLLAFIDDLKAQAA